LSDTLKNAIDGYTLAIDNYYKQIEANSSDTDAVSKAVSAINSANTFLSNLKNTEIVTSYKSELATLIDLYTSKINSLNSEIEALETKKSDYTTSLQSFETNSTTSLDNFNTKSSELFDSFNTEVNSITETLKESVYNMLSTDLTNGTLTVANSQNLEGSSKEELKSETLKEVAGYKNQIINGDFRVKQRLTSSNPSSGEYLIDRWIYTKNGSGESVEVTNGYDSTIKSKYLKINQSVASSGASVREIAQRVEDCSRFDGVVVTLSFYVKGTIGKTITPILKQRNGDSATLNTYNGANVTLDGTWQKVTKSFELSDISDTLTQVDTSYLNVALSLPLDEIYEVSISQVQLEYSEVATEFEKRDYTLEETMCKRYYREEQVTVSAIHDEGYSLNSGSLQFDVAMRVVPSVSVESFMVLGHSIGSVDYVYPTQRGMHWDIISTNVAYRPFGVRHQIKYKASAEL
jgi:predicted  nucleic acid-binding Zn-ribbon protein